MSTYTCFRIFNVNYVDVDILADYEASSANANFPITNLFNQNRRSKVWRSAGLWTFTTSNNRIIFRESVGVDLTAVLNTGTFASFALLAAEIKARMEAVSGAASTYTITQSNNFINIESDGGGGGGIFQIYLSGSTAAAEIGLTADKTGALSYNMDTIETHGSTGEFIEFDMGVSTNPDAFIAIDQKGASLKISPTATIKLQGNETGNWSDPSYNQTITYDDEVLSRLDDSGLASEAYRYWRLYLDDPANPNGYIQLGAVFLGNYMSWSRARANFPLNQSYEDRSTTVFAEGGQSFSDIKSKTQSFTVTLNGMQKADVEEYDIFFNDFGVGKPFFVSMDTDEVFSSDMNRRIMLCKMDKPPKWRLISPDFFALELSLREEL